MISVQKKSQLTGKINTMTLNVTYAQLTAYQKGEALIQDIFPQLNADEREFILNGITPDEWKEKFGGSE
jgi:hypothetical protein